MFLHKIANLVSVIVIEASLLSNKGHRPIVKTLPHYSCLMTNVGATLYLSDSLKVSCEYFYYNIIDSSKKIEDYVKCVFFNERIKVMNREYFF